MNGVEALALAEQAGVSVEVRGESLVLRARHRPSADVLNSLRSSKAGLIEVLSRPRLVSSAGVIDISAMPADRATGHRPNCATDWLAFFDERAAIAEFDGGLSRRKAEAEAYEWCVVEWMNQHHPAGASDDRCLWCGDTGWPGKAIVPFGAQANAIVWLHPRCWESWQRSRRALAEAELGLMGVRKPGVEAVSLDD
ncbi:MAG: hypothetical protein IT535_04430 [Bauldia sp.]|nr:hypothetical protein [Bauldia sp.]